MRLAAIALIHLFCFDCVPGQVAGNPVSGSPAKGAASEASNETRRESSLWSFDLFISSVFDSNIDHDSDSVDSIGLAYGMKVNFRDRPSRPLFKLSYAITSQSYSNTERWDRVSHNLEASFEKRAGRRLSFETSGEISLKGSLEDRELGNQYILWQRVKYRLSGNNRLNLYGAYRLKQYEDERRNATNPIAGFKFERSFGGRRTLELGYRYEVNHAREYTRRYSRSTYSAEYTTPVLGNDRLSAEFKYRPQEYYFLFRSDGERVHRQDHRWALSVSWAIPLRQDLELTPSYKYETRSSNYPARDFGAHLAGLTLRYRW
jgi:hypothetical protein